VTVYVGTREEPSDAVDRFFGLIDHPVLSNIRVDWKGLAVRDVEPATIPDLFASRPVILHGRYAKAGGATIEVSGEVGGEKVTFPVAVTFPEQARDHASLETLWARARIERHMEDMWYGVGDRSAEVTKLGLEHRIVTAWTSLVAVDTSRKVEGGGADTPSVRQAVDLPEGVSRMALAGNASSLNGLIAGAPMAPSPAVMPAESSGAVGLGFSGTGVGGSGVGHGSIGFVGGKSAPKKMRSPSPEASSASGGPEVMRVVRRHLPSLRKAFQRALSRDPKLAGAKLTLRLTIGSDGRVVRAEILGGPSDPGLKKELLRLARSWTFPKRDAPMTVSVPLALSP
jgi:Ca-activated chloride channel family protein